jgi:hypothetical protein
MCCLARSVSEKPGDPIRLPTRAMGPPGRSVPPGLVRIDSSVVVHPRQPVVRGGVHRPTVWPGDPVPTVGVKRTRERPEGESTGGDKSGGAESVDEVAARLYASLMTTEGLRMLLTASAALLSCVVAVISAMLSYVFTRRNQRELETLRAELEDRRRERDARRDYEYEARKRLYTECGPVLLQLNEASESALRRIARLASAARQGSLGPDRPSWLGDSRSYFFASTLYRLFSPLAVAKLLQRRLTLIDLSLDDSIFIQYTLARELLDAFSADFQLANRTPRLPYQLEPADSTEGELSGMGLSRRQGIHRGVVDAVTESLIVQQDGRPLRIRGFAEFEAEYRDDQSRVGAAFRRVDYIFKDFHPRAHPVCWRMLIAQAYIYRALIQTYACIDTKVSLESTWSMPPEERELFQWARADDSSDDPFEAVEGYFDNRFRFVVDEKTSIMSRSLFDRALPDRRNQT